MTRKLFDQIFESTIKLPYEQRRFAFREGLTILFDLLEESDDVHTEHDQIWYGNVNAVLDKIQPQQILRLAELGWFVDEDSFSFWT